MRGSMSWNDTVKAAGLAALAGRTSTTASNAIDTRRIWAPHDVWVSRVRQPRDLDAQFRPGSTTTHR